MGDVSFDSKEIQDLAKKVGTLEPFFTEKEHALLLAIFAAAVERTNVPNPGQGVLPMAEMDTQQPAQPEGAQPGGAQPEGAQPGGAQPGGAQPTLTDLQRQLLHAYYPGAGPHGGGFTFKITGVPPIN